MNLDDEKIKEIEAAAFERAADLAGYWMIHDPKLVVPSLKAEAACRRPGYEPARPKKPPVEFFMEGAIRPTPCLDPEKMHGFCDQNGGSDYP